MKKLPLRYIEKIQGIKTHTKRLLYLSLVILSIVSVIAMIISFIINIFDLLDKRKNQIFIRIQMILFIPYIYSFFMIFELGMRYKAQSVPLESLFPVVLIQIGISFTLLCLTLYENKEKNKGRGELILNTIILALCILAIGIRLDPYFVRTYIPESEKLYFALELKQQSFMTYPEFERLNSFLELDNNSQVKNFFIRVKTKEDEGKFNIQSVNLEGIKDMSIEGIRSHLSTQEVSFQYDAYGEYYVLNPNSERPFGYVRKILSEEEVNGILESIYNDGGDTDNYGGITDWEIKNLSGDLRDKIKYVCGDLENSEYNRIAKELNINIEKFQKDFRRCYLGQGVDNNPIVDINRYE